MAVLSLNFASSGDDNIISLVEDFELGGNKSIHRLGEKSFVRIYPSGADLSFYLSGGTWKYHSKGIFETITEFIPFKDTFSGRLKFPAVNVLSVSPSDDGVFPYVGGRQVNFLQKKLASIAVTYETSFDVIEITGTRQGYAVLRVEGAGAAAYIAVDYTEDEIDSSSRIVILTARDAASREIIPNAEIFLNGSYRGLTDGGGMINLGRLKKGLYSLLVKKEGYLDTDKDNLRNDSFRVE